MTRLISILLLLALIVGGVWLVWPAPAAPISANLSVAEALSNDTAGFARVTEPRPFTFPADHGPHPEYKTEWWYYTGNLAGADGRNWGFQLTFFRNALTPRPQQRSSDWGTNDIYMAHFALSDIGAEKFYATERFSRGGAGLAGAEAEPFRVWTESWEASGDPESGTRLRATNGGVAIDLQARNTRPAVLQGNQGLSQKSDEPGNASYYYSLTRMQTDGTITVDGQSYAVSGLTWMDREWGTSALGPEQTGWDWFALHLDDGSDLMWAQIRRADGSLDMGYGSLDAPGGVTQLGRDDVQLAVLERWTSPRSGGHYPSGWRMQVPKTGLDITIEPYLADQELPLSVMYWEGAVRFSGTVAGKPVAGEGYVEMTGYAGSQQNDPNSRSR